MRVRKKYIRSVAERLIASHALSCAPVRVEQCAVALGINIRSTRPGDVSLSGFLVRSKSGLRISLRDGDSSKGTETEEIEANIFAAELLMPVEFLRKDIASSKINDEESLKKALGRLAKKYEVSNEALTYRLVNLGYIHL